MKRIVARFEQANDAEAAAADLREAGFEPERPAFDNRFFDPTAQVPEARGLAVGAIVGGLIGLGLLQAINAGLLWIPRVSPLLSADELAVPVLGLGLGIAIGGFVGGVAGTLRPLPESEHSEIAVETPDDRIAETEELLRNHDAAAVEGRVTHHETPGNTPKQSIRR